MTSARFACLQRHARHRARQCANAATLSTTRATPHSLRHNTLTKSLPLLLPEGFFWGLRQAIFLYGHDPMEPSIPPQESHSTHGHLEVPRTSQSPREIASTLTAPTPRH